MLERRFQVLCAEKRPRNEEIDGVVYVYICDTFDDFNDHGACTSRRFTTTTSTAARADVPPSSHFGLSSRHRSCAYRVQRRRCWLHVINLVSFPSPPSFENYYVHKAVQKL